MNSHLTAVSREQAQGYLRAVEDKFSAWIEAAGARGPELIPDWDGRGHWAVVWEDSSPYEWAACPVDWEYTDLDTGAKVPGVPAPGGIFAEPYYSFVMVLYPGEA